MQNQLFSTFASPSFKKDLEIELFIETGFGIGKKRIKSDNVDLTTLSKQNLKKLLPIIEDSANAEIGKLNYLNNQLNEAKKKKFHIKGSDQNAIYLGFLSRIAIKEEKIILLEKALDFVANKIGEHEPYSEEID